MKNQFMDRPIMDWPAHLLPARRLKFEHSPGEKNYGTAGHHSEMLSSTRGECGRNIGRNIDGLDF
jgi:hypothetical protein